VADDLHLFHITCGGCTADWAGDDRAHCGHCHTTFDSTALYDGHRAGGRCARPRTLGLVPTKNGIWREPAPGRRRTG
jgi:predicted amidophosphoribosyltransferase